MRKSLFVIPILLVTCLTASAQKHTPQVKLVFGAVACPALPGGTPHEAEYCWSVTNVTAANITIYQASGACPASGQPSGAVQITTSTSLSGSFINPSVNAAATYCGYASATAAGQTGVSPNVQFTIPVFAPTSLSGTVSGASANLTWTASSDAGTTVNVLQAGGNCGASGQTFSTVASGVAAGGPYTVNNLAAGSYCFEVSATLGGVTSVGSSGFQLAVAAPIPAASLTVVVQ